MGHSGFQGEQGLRGFSPPAALNWKPTQRPAGTLWGNVQTSPSDFVKQEE